MGVQHADAKTATELDGLVLREIQPSDFLSAISFVALMHLEGNLAMFGFVYYGEECTPSALLLSLSVCLPGPRCPPLLHN